MTSTTRTSYRPVGRICFLLAWLACTGVASGRDDIPAGNDAGIAPVLVNSVMCEGLRGQQPIHPAVVFSIRGGKVVCLTEFEQIPSPMSIYHKWYRRDVLINTIPLKLQPARWATYSSVGLRETDRGPWRVEVSDDRGEVFAVLRFSIVD